ncbi:hypothetical protein [Serratia odorifera]|uniref:hypothetical protein n=1 Tax=Serratia odorifera TaxID=618 RepID=UPI0018E84EA2|nr:hypothetical protein [Serratia odorifera]MBJ2066827.1 hypothetical protein [Serratia odorifera]
MSNQGEQPDGGQGGFTYLFVLLALTVLALALLKSQEMIKVHHHQQQEDELLFRGEQIRQAINSYQQASYANGCYPPGFDALLVDARGGKKNYHLRRWFVDPLTGSQQWGMVHDQKGRWIGVHSQGHGRPLRKDGFGSHVDEDKFKRATDYSEWVFLADTDAAAPLPSACQSR